MVVLMVFITNYMETTSNDLKDFIPTDVRTSNLAKHHLISTLSSRCTVSFLYLYSLQISLPNEIFYPLKRTTELKIAEGKYITLKLCG
jgi:hypothetical protein